jgi:uncharacterized protein Yka (UPF0111/DUF47 family)
VTPITAKGRDAALLDLFEAAGRNAERASELLREMLSDFPERAGLARDVLLCEQEGDRLTHDILLRLNGSNGKWRLPPADIHSLASALDDVVDYTEQTADTLGLYGIEAPMEQAEELAAVLVESTHAVTRALVALRSGEDLSPLLFEINRLENEGDRVSRAGIASLFATGIDPMVVIRWKDILGSLEQAIDSCETVAHVLEGIILKMAR